jgi:hypothetical protein
MLHNYFCSTIQTLEKMNPSAKPKRDFSRFATFVIGAHIDVINSIARDFQMGVEEKLTLNLLDGSATIDTACGSTLQIIAECLALGKFEDLPDRYRGKQAAWDRRHAPASRPKIHSGF